MTPKDQAISLLKNGIPAAQVSEALGISESQISQWANEESIAAEISQALARVSVRNVTFDNTLDEIEHTAADLVKKKLPYANLQQAAAILEKVNRLQRRALHKPGSTSGAPGIQVNIVIPNSLMPQLVTNSKSEVIEVDGRTMLAASQSQLNRLLEEHTGKKVADTSISDVKHIRAQEMLEQLPAPARQRSNSSVKLQDLDLSDII